MLVGRRYVRQMSVREGSPGKMLAGQSSVSLLVMACQLNIGLGKFMSFKVLPAKCLPSKCLPWSKVY
jgi:hypothetical protein